MGILVLLAVFTADASDRDGTAFSMVYAAFLVFTTWLWYTVHRRDRQDRPEFLEITGRYVVAMGVSAFIAAAGISGGDLTERAVVQAEKFGAYLTSPCAATALRQEHGHLVVRLSDGTDVAGRATRRPAGRAGPAASRPGAPGPATQPRRWPVHAGVEIQRVPTCGTSSRAGRLSHLQLSSLTASPYRLLG
jgi:hypothetical protein